MRRSVLDFKAILEALQTTSRMTAIRRLSELSYLSSYSHSGGYYTLPGIPQFDEDGLWLFQGIGFSRHGTLIDTAAVLIDGAEAGFFHRELQARLRIRAHNQLLQLVETGRVSRHTVANDYLYVSADSARAAAQLVRRGDPRIGSAAGERPLPPALVVEILLDVVHSAGIRADAAATAARLTARGVVVTGEVVREVFGQYGLREKKTRSP